MEDPRNLIDPIIYWLGMLATPSKLVRECLLVGQSNNWKAVIRLWVIPISISIVVDAGLVLTAYGFDCYRIGLLGFCISFGLFSSG